MPETSNGDPFFDIKISGAVAKTFRKLQRQASQEGRGAEALSAFRMIINRLQHDPRSFGEPIYRLPAMNLQVRVCTIRPISVQVGVSDDKPLVFIRDAFLMAKDTK